jgi:phage shock protein E
MKRLFSALLLGLTVPSMPTLAASATDPAAAKPGKVDGATAKTLAASGAKVVDVRTPEEFASGHVPGAINIPYDQLPRRAAEIGPPSTRVILYCRSGRRSGIAFEALQKAGYPNLYDFGAVTSWPGALVK